MPLSLTNDDRERSASDRIGKESKKHKKKIRPSEVGADLTTVQKAEYINSSGSGLKVADPNSSSKILRTLIAKADNMSEAQKLFACTVFEGLSPEERAQLSTEDAMYNVIGQAVSSMPDPDDDGRIPDGGHKGLPFLHLYKSTGAPGEPGTISYDKPRNPDACPRDFPIIRVTTALREAIEYAMQNYVYTWNPTTTKDCPKPEEERPYHLIAKGYLGDLVNRIRGMLVKEIPARPDVPEQRNQLIDDQVYPPFTRMGVSGHVAKAFVLP